MLLLGKLLWLFLKDKPIRIGYDMNAREELIRSYNEKEISLSESMEKEKRMTKNLKMEIKGKKERIWSNMKELKRILFLALKNYAR